MSNNDNLDIFVKVVQDTQNKRQRKIENFINAAVDEISRQVQLTLYLKALEANPEVASELETWAESHKDDFAFSLGETARILLHRELLEDKHEPS